MSGVASHDVQVGADTAQRSTGPVNTTVTLNGLDNVGKTTHLRWLARAVPGSRLVGSIDQWDPRWHALGGAGFARWWFADSSTAEHVELVFTSQAARCAGGAGAIALQDRGWPMLVAMCAATAAVKESRRIEDTVDEVERSAATFGDRDGPAIHVLLRHDADPSREAHWALHREPQPMSPWYAAYQRALATAIEIQAERGRFSAVVQRGSRPLVAVHRDIREKLATLGVPVAALPADRVLQLLVLGGLSESGKSTVGELLRIEHGVTRLKIGYLLESAAARAGFDDPYAWDECTQAQELSEEILRFAAGNPGSSRISVESAHRFDATAHLKQIWGERCQIIYLQAAQKIRMSRTLESDIELESRDSTKQARGADRIVEIADRVIDNSGGLAALKTATATMAAAPMRRLPAPATTAVVPEQVRPFVDAWLTQVVDDATALAAVTGSLAHGGWRAGWSDVDLLVVRDRLPVSWLRERLGVMPALEGAKVAVSAFTTADLAAGRVPPRLLHTLRQLGNHARGVLFQRAGFMIASVDDIADDRASRAELPLVVMVLRRIAAQPEIDVRALYKHITLVMKILLRADGVAAEASDDVIAAFQQTHSDAGVTLPVLAELPAQWRTDPRLAATILKAADATLGYLEKSGTASETAVGR